MLSRDSRGHVSLNAGKTDASLTKAVPRDGAVSTRAFDRVAKAPDASHYLLTPKAVVTPEGVEEIACLFAFANEHREQLTFRSGGTSLSGQSSSDAILVDTRRHFRSVQVTSDGMVAQCGPGATVRQVNARLLRHGRKLGPDPASEIACTIGGVVANNSSGMACGITENAYQTLRSAVFVTPRGTIVDTSNVDSDAALVAAEPELCRVLMRLRAEIISDPHLSAEISRQYRIKNTMGYGLNSLVDHDTPSQILAHLLVGSEGTLGFIAEVTFNTVPLRKHSLTALLVFHSIQEATEALVDIVDSEPAIVELMDAASLKAAATDPLAAAALPTIEVLDHCALLIEYQTDEADELIVIRENAERLFSRMNLATTPSLSGDAGRRAALWRIRKGLYPTIAGNRPTGTTALLEDIAVPVANLSELCTRLRQLFSSHGYDDAVIFGHAKDGNIHFLITERFDSPTGIGRYRSFTEGLVDLVLSSGGTLKAEHGTGRVMAPFVERQFGSTLYRMMLEIKKAADPNGILNPDAIFTSDPDHYLYHLKSTPTVEEEVDRCVECGYCEPVCPSQDLTTTPRERIVVRRAIADAEALGDMALARALRRDEDYDSVETCAVDGMCQTACPVLINTGDLVRRIRAESAGAVKNGAWSLASNSWAPVSDAAAAVLTVASRIPASVPRNASIVARAVLGKDSVPLWTRDLPAGGQRRSRLNGGSRGTTTPDAVYFPSCVGRMFGSEDRGAGVGPALLSLAELGGKNLVMPPGIDALCCGTPWKSKGLRSGYDDMIARLAESLWTMTDEGRIPIVSDNSSCSEGLTQVAEIIGQRSSEPPMRVIDAVDYAASEILPRLKIDRMLGRVAVHPTCSSTRAGSNANLLLLANAVAHEAVVPDDWGCCGFAGDRGMLHPELTAQASRREAAEVNDGDFDAYVSCNRMCEIGMSRATHRRYEHVIELVERLTRIESGAPRQ
jgi:D-lactate dehydrogenase